MLKGKTIALHEKNQFEMQMYPSCWALIYIEMHEDWLMIDLLIC